MKTFKEFLMEAASMASQYVVFTKQARKSKTGVTYAPGQNTETKLYIIFKLKSNYDGQVRGGIRKSWVVASNGKSGDAKDLTLDQAKAVFEKKLGYKVYGVDTGA